MLPSMIADEPADVFKHFRVLRRPDGRLWELGRGAMGVTYKAEDTNLHSTVALKVVNTFHLKSDTDRARFLREARATAALRHPNVASVYHLSNDDQCFFYAMEFVEGETLEDFVARHGPVNPVLGLDIVDQIARALSAAARQNLIHRDIKPANVMLVQKDEEDEDEDGYRQVKLIDFGLAKSTIASDGSGSTVRVTMTGFVGTPLYASPEQLEELDLDSRTDIYFGRLQAAPHPGLVALLGYGEDRGARYIATEQLRGFTLVDLLRARAGAIELTEALALADQAAADHACLRDLPAINLDPHALTVHFAGGGNVSPHLPLSDWPDFFVKAVPIDPDAESAQPTWAVLETVLPQPYAPSGSDGSNTPVLALARLVYELVGGHPPAPSDRYIPLSVLNEAANDLLRAALLAASASPTTAPVAKRQPRDVPATAARSTLLPEHPRKTVARAINTSAPEARQTAASSTPRPPTFPKVAARETRPAPSVATPAPPPRQYLPPCHSRQLTAPTV